MTGFNLEDVVGALPYPVVVVNGDDDIDYINGSAENFFEQGNNFLVGRQISKFLPPDSPVHSLLSQVRTEGVSISEYDVDLTLQRGGGRRLAIHAAPFGDESGRAVLSFHAQGAARNMERQLSHRSAARSVSAMAAMLAHEVKNPLSGIRGAAQLLERVVEGTDQDLARLICGEIAFARWWIVWGASLRMVRWIARRLIFTKCSKGCNDPRRQVSPGM